MEEKNLDRYACRHGVDAIFTNWEMPDPAECAMRAEDGFGEAVERAEAMEVFLAYCFADAAPEEWPLVACRAHAAMAAMWPHVIAQRDQTEIRALRPTVRAVHGFPLAGLVERFEELEVMDDFARVVEFFFPRVRNWLLAGTQHLYLVSRLYAPGLVTRWQGELTFEAMAGVFGEIPLPPPDAIRETWMPEGWTGEAWRTARDRARSRWSARAQHLITRKIESAGAVRPQMFGKSATVAEKYRCAAMGNSNRRAKG